MGSDSNDWRGKTGAEKECGFRLAEFGGAQEGLGGLPVGHLIQKIPQGQSVGSAGHPSGHRRGPAPPRRPLLGPPPAASHDGPTTSPGLGGASPGGVHEGGLRRDKDRSGVGRENPKMQG